MDLTSTPNPPAKFFPKISKAQILSIFRNPCHSDESFQSLFEEMPEIFSKDILEPENCKPSQEVNPSDLFVETVITPKPMRLVSQKRVYIPKSPFTSSGYAEDPTARVWYYRDEGNIIQGPFTSLEMDFWFDNGFLFNELLIRIKENNDFVKLIHLFGKTEIIQVYKPVPPSMLEQFYQQQQLDQAPKSAEFRREEQLSSSKPIVKKQSIYNFGFEPEKLGQSSTPLKTPEKANSVKSDSVNEEQKRNPELEGKGKTDGINYQSGQEKKNTEPEIIKWQEQKEEEKAKQETLDLKKTVKEISQAVTSQSKEKCNEDTTRMNEKKRDEEKATLVLISPCKDIPEKSPNSKKEFGRYQAEKNADRERDHYQTNKKVKEIIYVPKEEKRTEEKIEKVKTNGNQPRKGQKQEHYEAKDSKGSQSNAGTPYKKGQATVVFVPKKKEETIYVAKPKTNEQIVAEGQEQNREKEDLNIAPLSRKESDTFESLKATSEYYENKNLQESLSQPDQLNSSLPPGLQQETLSANVSSKGGLQRKPKEKLRLLPNPYDEYEQAQEMIVATSLGLLELEQETAGPTKKSPVRNGLKPKSATPSPLIINNTTIGQLYNFSEDLNYFSFNQAGGYAKQNS